MKRILQSHKLNLITMKIDQWISIDQFLSEFHHDDIKTILNMQI